jgi:hypothetical protein
MAKNTKKIGVKIKTEKQSYEILVDKAVTRPAHH